MAYSELSAIAEDRSRIYWLLSRFFLDAPDLHSLGDPGSGDDISTAEDELTDALRQLRAGMSGTPAAELRAEHLRLFGGVREGFGPPPPYESLYREGRLLGESTESVVAHYRRNGLSLADEEAGPEDHLGLELKYLALLCYRESQLWRDGDAAGGRQALASQRAFLTNHLLAWVPAYCNNLQDATAYPYFRAVAKLTTKSIDRDAQLVDELLNELPHAGADTNIQGGLQ